MIRLSDNQKIKLKTFYENKEYSNFEIEVESLGDFNDLPEFLKVGYAGSKVLNPNSKKKDYMLAVSLLDKVVKENNNKEALYNLIAASIKSETYHQTIPHLIEHYNLDNKDPKILEGLAKINFDLGNIDVAIKYYSELENLNLDKTINGTRLTCLFSKNYLSEITQEKYFEESSKIQNVFDKQSLFSTFKDINNNNKKLKVGFLSGDFKQHSVGTFFKGFISRINKKDFNIVGFSNLGINKHDDVTKIIKSNFNEWHDILHLSDERLIDFIRSLNIDILIDLSGYSLGNRINIFAARCSPIQIIWLGYNNSTGLKNMDYILADFNLIKESERHLYVEKILYLPKIWNAMEKHNNLPELVELADLKDNVFNFGSFNNFKKISSETVLVWSKILNTSNSRLFLKNSPGYNEEVINNLKSKFQKKNVDLNKIIFLKNKKTYEEHLQDYNKIDLSLDTFPYPGVTTSFESNSMGVPVLTLKGFNLNSRCGESINKNLKLEDFIAKNYDDYLNKAVLLSKKKKNTILLRRLHRQKIMVSSLFDIDNFTIELSKILKSLKKIK